MNQDFKKAKSALDYHLHKAQHLGRKYQMLKIIGAPHKRLHNIDREMRWHLKKCLQIKNKKVNI